MYFKDDWAVIVPLANEAATLPALAAALKAVMDKLGSGKVYWVVDHASKDQTRSLCEQMALRDPRFVLVWAPENRNVVDAYLAGYQAAYDAGHALIIEMDGGLSHDPRAIPQFLRVLNEGNQCAFGSRFINGGSTADSSIKRWFLSKMGTWVSNILLGTRLADATSGYQGFHRHVVGTFLQHGLKSQAHFYQTELRFLLRKTRYMEVPIHYRAPSPSVSQKALSNSLECLWYYVSRRIRGIEDIIDVGFEPADIWLGRLGDE